MKSMQIALKDLTLSFRTPSALLFMFGIPLLVTGLFYLMFGNIGQSDGLDFAPPTMTVINLDQGNETTGNLGEMLVQALLSDAVTGFLDVSVVDDQEAAREQVLKGELAGLVIIPADFSAAFSDPQGKATIELVVDPASQFSPELMKTALSRILDVFTGFRVTINGAINAVQRGELAADQISGLIDDFTRRQTSQLGSIIELESITEEEPSGSLLTYIVSTIMAAMLIFFSFFTSVHTVSTILQEQENHTLQRLFVTPTTTREVLSGKFLAVLFILIIQATVLILVSVGIFGVNWGQPMLVGLAAAGTVLIAAAFGIFLVSWMSSMRQAGLVFGGVVTITGMVGLVDAFTGQPGSQTFGILPLIAPQGWAGKLMLGVQAGMDLPALLPWLGGTLLFALILFLIGVLRFSRRFS